MGGCSTHSTQASQAVAPPDAVTQRVEDMTHAHWAGALKRTIETSLPAAEVEANLAFSLVPVSGATDLSSIKAIVTSVGDTLTAA